ARSAARRRRRRRPRVRRGRSRGGCGGRAACAAPPPPAPPNPPRPSRRAGGQHLLEAPAAQRLEAAVVGEVEVDRGDRDPPLSDRVEVGPRDLLVAGFAAVDLVAPPPLV